jgi:DNA-binding Xre family transcriptional regulator
MAVSYNKLWKLLIDRKMKKKDLQELAGVSASLVTKLGRDESVTTVALMKICAALNCDVGDIMEFVPGEPNGGISQ